MIRFIQKIILVLLFTSTSLIGNSQVIPLDNWKYFKGQSNPSIIGSNWFDENYNDQNWLNGIQPFQYGEGTDGTVIADMMNNYSTLYLRSTFDTIGVGKTEELSFLFDYDDGFILYFNGKELLKRNAPTNPNFNSFASADRERGESEIVKFVIPTKLILKSKNTIAVQLFNRTLNSSDIYFKLELTAKSTSPVAVAPMVDIPGGSYNAPFMVTIYPAVPGDIFYYTLDGSDPARSSSAVKCTSTTKVLIDPKSTTGRGLTPGVVLNVKTIKPSFSPSYLVSNTYLFINEVRTQKYPGGRWPSKPINNQVFDYVMDAKVTADIRYKDSIEIALKSIPSMMLTVDFDDLFDPTTGLYVNPRSRGAEFERPGNLELIGVDGIRKFRVGTGVRIRGGASRNPGNPKHSFMLFFKGEYGDTKLKYPLFENEGAKKFDRLDFRTSQNYSWSWKPINESKHNTYNRDNFSRDSQRDLGQPYTRSRWYHLYLNGLYMGLFETQERAEAKYADTYLGGNEEDYDVVKVARELWAIEATDGSLDIWNEIYAMCQKGFASNEDYYHLIGLNKDGIRDTTKRVFVDLDNLIDYMLVIFLTGNFDAPVTKFTTTAGPNMKPNNFYAMYDRTDKNKGFVFFAHDSEHSLHNVNENRVNIGYQTTNQMLDPGIDAFHPQWLHHKLCSNPNYRALFADRAYRALYNTGPLTSDANKKRFMNRANMIKTAVISESARWGDFKNSTPLNKVDHWIPAVSYVVNDYFTARTNIVINQLKEVGLLPGLSAPVIANNGTTIINQKNSLTSPNVSISNTNTNSQIVYTLLGNDPKTVSGAISTDGIVSNSTVSLNITDITHIKARVKTQNEWSPLREVFLTPTDYDLSGLKVTELHYHPTDSLGFSGKQLEFIELKNTGNKPLNLMGLSFVKGIDFTYEQKLILQPGAFSVIASNADAFKTIYGRYPDGVYNKSLSNGGELIQINDARDNLLISFEYSDDKPWPIFADGLGYSMVSFKTNPTDDPNQYFYWRASFNKGGSPYADDILNTSNVELNYSFGELRVYPNPASHFIMITSERAFENDVTVSIHSLNGSLVAKENIATFGNNNFEMSLEKYKLQRGVYVLNLQDTKHTQNVRLIIK
jgi:hypothetical protein